MKKFNFDSDDDGVPDSYGNGTFNVPPLVEAADTGPFFHTNAFGTIEDAVGFYNSEAFANSPGGVVVETVFGEGINLSEEQTEEVAAFLRVINAAFNLSMAIQRMEAARTITQAVIDGGHGFGAEAIPLTNGLLQLANEELRDALDVLREKGLNLSAHTEINTAIANNGGAIASTHPETEKAFIESALDSAFQAKDSLGTGLEFEMGEGNLVF